MTIVNSTNTPFLPPVDAGLLDQLITSQGDGTTIWADPATPILPINNVEVYVSKKIGSDVTGTGSYSLPFASINAALTAAILLPSGVNIVILDNEVYNETVDFSATSGINLIGETATIDYLSATGSAIISSIGMYIKLNSLSCTGGGNSLTNPTGDLYCDVVADINGNIVNTGSGNTAIRASSITGNITNSDGGTTRYICTLPRSGTDDAFTTGITTSAATGPFSISGLNYPTADGTADQFIGTDAASNLSLKSLTKANGDFDVVGTLTASSLIYPTTDGASGDVITTDGAGNLTFQTPAATGVTEVDTGTGLTGGPITTTGTISFANVTNDTILANISGISAAPSPNTLTDILDSSFDNSQGDILYRGASAWTYLAPGTSGQFLQTNGAAADPSWETVSAGGSNPTAISLSPSVFTYFNAITTGTLLWISSSAPNTQGAFVAGPTNDYGTYTFKVGAGTYNCCIIYPQGTGNGIMRIIINGGTPVDIDQYGTAINQYVSYQFSVSLVEGDNTIQCLTNGKNGSSTNYFLAFGSDIVFNRTGP